MTKDITTNRKAFFDYEILENYEAGVVLTGTEIKSVRAGQINIRDAYVRPIKSELWLIGAHIALYKAANSADNHDQYRSRKLLLHKNELTRLIDTVSQKGLTIVPLRVYVARHVAKIQLGLARGRRRHDKRRAIIEKEHIREMDRAMKNR